MYITISDITGGNLYVIPIVPDNISINKGGQNETLNTVKGDIRLVGDKSLTEISWSSLFPVYKDYGFVAIGSYPNGYDYVDFIQNCIESKVPVRIVITSAKKRSIVNMLATIDEGFAYEVDKAGDIKYSIKLTEFPSDNWDYINASPNLANFLKSMAFQSVAKKALAKVGLI